MALVPIFAGSLREVNMVRTFLAAFLLLIGGTLGSFARAESLILNIGEDFRVPVPANRRVWIQNRKVLRVSTKGRFIVFNGQSEGRTAALVGKETYQIQVVLPMKKNLFARFERENRHILGLKLKFQQQQVTVRGKLLRWEDWLSLAEASREMDVPYQMSADIPSSLRAKAQAYWQEQLSLAGLAPVPIQFSTPLQARVSVSAAVFEKYQNLLSPFGILVEKDAESLNIAPVIKVEITVAEVKRKLETHYGLKWPVSYSATLLPDGSREFENLVFTANALEDQGKGKILASPSLLCRSGKAAEFLAGGEFPIKIMNMHTRDVVWKKYGVLLKVRPTADSSGRMSIALDVEVSTIDGANTVDGIPGLLTNRISSHFDLAKSQTIALSGLIKNEESNASSGLPLMARIPVLGALFSSKEFRENRTELVIFVRPSIVKEGESLAGSISPAHIGEVNHD
jgi:pilus assembly protein CpaC